MTDEEFDEIIKIINNRLKDFVTQLILDDENKRNQLNGNPDSYDKSPNSKKI